MNFFPSSLQCLLVRCAVLFAFIGLPATAQQPAGDKSNVEIPRAGVSGVSMPKCQHGPDPEYPQEARKKKYEGVVVLMVVVTLAGKATDIQVIKSPGMGLDEKAIEAVRKWRFKPAMKDGKPVNVKMPIEITFRL
jgi:TonB family protein